MIIGAKYDLHSGGQGDYSMIFPQSYNFFQKVYKCKAFRPILGLYEVPSTVFAPLPGPRRLLFELP